VVVQQVPCSTLKPGAGLHFKRFIKKLVIKDTICLYIGPPPPFFLSKIARSTTLGATSFVESMSNFPSWFIPLRISVSIFWSPGLLVMNCFYISFCFWFWKVFISPYMKNSFCRYSNLGWQLFSFRAWSTSFHAFLALKISVEKPVLILIGLSLDRWLIAFNTLSLFCILNVLTMRYLREVVFWSCLIGVLKASCAYTFFSIFEKVFGITLLDMLSMPLLYTSSVSVPMFCRSSLLMLSQKSCMMYSYVFIFFFIFLWFWCSVFHLIQSTEVFQLIFLFDFISLFISGVSIWYFSKISLSLLIFPLYSLHYFPYFFSQLFICILFEFI
jgi:hypothetical protein